MRSTSFFSVPFPFVSLGASLFFAGTKACSWRLLATVASPDFLVYCNHCLNLKWNSLRPVLQSPTFSFSLREHPTAPIAVSLLPTLLPYSIRSRKLHHTLSQQGVDAATGESGANSAGQVRSCRWAFCWVGFIAWGRFISLMQREAQKVGTHRLR